jgi:isopentenyl diphosphate isomerase/L-lactate dehydrogenase-like FMN-dependent dehydrogenase
VRRRPHSGQDSLLKVYQTVFLPDAVQVLLDNAFVTYRHDGAQNPVSALNALSVPPDAVLCSINDFRLDRAAIAALPEATRVIASYSVGLDGGIRRGTDMLKAMALGASGCMAGRPGLYGLAAAGTPGATRVLQLMQAEFERDMALLGLPDIGSISRESIIRRPDHDCKTVDGCFG